MRTPKALVQKYPASTATPLVAAVLAWAAEHWKWDKSDRQLAYTVVALTPAAVTAAVQWARRTFFSSDEEDSE